MRFIILIFSALVTGCSTNKISSPQEWEAQKSTLDSLIRTTQYEDAIKMAQDRIEIAERSNMNDFQLSNAYSDLGLIYQQMGRYDLSKTYFEKSLSTYPDNGVAHYNYGLLNRDIANYDKALEEFQFALDLYNKDNNEIYKKHSPTLVQLGIATVLTRTLKLDSARKLTDKVIFYATNNGDSAMLYSAKINSSLIHLYSKDFKSAKDSYYDILNNYPSPNSQEHANLLNSLGTIYYFQQRYDSAIYFFNGSMNVKLKEYSDSMMVKTNLKNLIQAYKLNNQDSKSKELEVALRKLENR